jgi:hypothetical protein
MRQRSVGWGALSNAAMRSAKLIVVAQPVACPHYETTRADDLKHRCTFARGLGSASEAHSPARHGPGGAFLSAIFPSFRWGFRWGVFGGVANLSV